MTIDLEWMARSLEAMKEEFARHHKWTENYFDGERYRLQQSIEELKAKVAGLEIKLEERS